MRIGVNLRPFRPEIMGGQGDYFRELMGRLAESGHRFHLFTAPWNHDFLDVRGPNCRKVLVPEGASPPGLLGRVRARLGKVRRKLTGPYAEWEAHPASRLQLDAWFCPFSALEPRPVPLPSVVTIPDAQHESYPEFFPESELSHRRAYFPATCLMSSVIITVSQFSKQDLIRLYQTPADKVCVIHHGVSSRFFQCDPGDAEVRAIYRLPDSYLYYPANIWQHKNHQLLLIALRRLKASGQRIPPLVLSGAPLDSVAELTLLARQLDVNCVYLGYTPAEHVPAIYRGALMLVFPSLFEGFGMPVLEAMAAGVPVAASNATSVPEVAGDAALLFDPRRPDEIAGVINRLLTDQALRERLVRRGIERARLFTWDRAAGETVAVFESVVRGHSSVQVEANCQGLMPDRWMGRSLTVRVKGMRCRRLVVEAVSTIQRRDFYPQTLTVSSGWKNLCKLKLAADGECRLHCDLARLGDAFELRLAANRTFVPLAEGWSEDTRELSVRISKLVLERDGETISLLDR